jgi:hypothetical protein
MIQFLPPKYLFPVLLSAPFRIIPLPLPGGIRAAPPLQVQRHIFYSSLLYTNVIIGINQFCITSLGHEIQWLMTAVDFGI